MGGTPPPGDAEGSGVVVLPLGDGLDESDGLALDESVAVALGFVGLAESVGVPDPVHTASAAPGLAGTTSKAPKATVPVATTPTTDAADRPRRVCFGTVITPSHRR